MNKLTFTFWFWIAMAAFQFMYGLVSIHTPVVLFFGFFFGSISLGCAFAEYIEGSDEP